MDTKNVNGNRIAPIPLQGGVQTIQQSIYLTHKNPCGQNELLDNEVGNTGITYRQFADLLSQAINQPVCLEAYRLLQEAVLLVSENPTQQNVLNYINLFFQYAKTVYEEAIEDVIVFEGYKTVFTCYEANGTTIFDSSTKQVENPIYPAYFPPVYQNPSTNELSLTPVTMIVPQPFTFNINWDPMQPYNTSQCSLPRFPGLISPPYPPDPINPFCTLSQVTTPFYTMLGTPSYWPYIWKRAVAPYGDQEYIVDSPFMVNQTSMTESVMAIASLLVDPANTRTYPAIGFGFSARAAIPGNGSVCYNVCLMQFLRTESGGGLNTFNDLQDIFFVRLSLQKI